MTAYRDFQVAVIVAGRARGASVKAIARDLGVSPARVAQIITEAKLARPRARPIEEYAKVGKLRQDGMSIGGIARHLGITKNTAAGMIRKVQALGGGVSL